MRKTVVLLVLLAAFLAAFAWSIWPRNEPRYQGARVSFWIDLPGYEATQLGYFPGADSNAIPYLVKGLKRKNSLVRQEYASIYGVLPAWSKKHLRAPRKFTDWMVRASAAQLLGRVGTNSPAAISGLLSVLTHEKTPLVRVYAVESLQKIGQGNDAVETGIIQALSDKAPEVRDAAEDALRQLDPVRAKSLLK